MIHAIRAAMEKHQIQSLPLSDIVELEVVVFRWNLKTYERRTVKRGKKTGRIGRVLPLNRQY